MTTTARRLARAHQRDALTADLGQYTPALARTVQLVSGDFLLTVNPVDGSEIVRPGERPQRPTKVRAAERADLARAALPPVPPGPAQARLPLLERQEERERGSSACWRAGAPYASPAPPAPAAPACSTPSPTTARTSPTASSASADTGTRRPTCCRPVRRCPQRLCSSERDELLELVHGIGAVVVLDDVEIGGTALDELLDATPECAFVIAATPDVPAPSADSLLEGSSWRTRPQRRPRAPGADRRTRGRRRRTGRATSGSSPRVCRCASCRPVLLRRRRRRCRHGESLRRLQRA